MYQQIPVVPSSKAAGHLREYVSDPITFLNDNWKKHGDVFRFRLAHRWLIVTFNPEHIKQLLQEDHSSYRKSLAYRKLRLLLGDGLFAGDGKSWLQQRRLSQPAFHKERLNHYFQDMDKAARELTEGWNNQKKINVIAEMTAVTLKIISKALLNVDLAKEENKVIGQHLPYALDFMIKRVTSTVNWPLVLPFPKHNRFRKAVKSMDGMIGEIIHERRNNEYSHDLLSMLMQAKDADTGETMDDKHLRDEILTFFLAGHETTAMAMSWMLYWLAIAPEVQRKLREEIQSVSDGSLDISVLQKMNYTKNVIKETLRMMSPVWIMGREALRPVKLGEHSLKKGESVIFSPFLIHRHPAHWESPEVFNPDRFSPQTEDKMHKYSYFPFGGGPRLCIGNNFAMMEMQILIAQIIKNYKLSLSEAVHPGYHFSLTLRPKKEIVVKLEKVR